MKKDSCLKKWALVLCVALFLQTASFFATAQCTSSVDIDKQLRVVENDVSLSFNQKLIKVNALKSQFTSCGFFKDSVYARMLHRISVLEYNSNNHIITSSIIENTLASIHINMSGAKNSSPKFAINSYYNIAAFYEVILQYTKALAYCDTVILLNTKYPEQQRFTKEALKMQAKIYIIKGDYQKCLEICSHGIDISLQSFDTTDLANFYNFRSLAYNFLASWHSAMEDADYGYVYASHVGDDNGITNALKLKAMIYAQKNDFDSAEVYFEKTLQRQRQSADTEKLSSIYIDYGNYFSDKKNNYAKAIVCYKQVVNLLEPAKKSIALSQAYNDIGQAYFRLNLLDKSKDSYEKSFSKLGIPISSNFLQTIAVASFSLVVDKQLLLAILNNKTEILLAFYKNTHDQKWLNACLETARTTDSVITQTRQEQLGEKSKLYWRDYTRDFFSNVIEACYLAGDANKTFYFLEKSRAVLLYDKINELNADSRLSADEASKEESYQIKLVEQQQKLSTLQPTSAEYGKQQLIFYQTEDDFDRYVLSLENKHPLYYQYKYADDVPSLQSLQQYLAKNNQSFVYYFLGDTALYALAITKNKTSFLKISPTEFNGKQLTQFINLCSNKNELMNHYADFAFLSQTIYNKIFKPLQIPSGNVAICTDNFFIPFEALCTDDKGKNFLLNQYNFSYVYSARSLLKPFTNKAASGNFIGFAPVSFSSSLNVPPLSQSASALQKSAHWYSNKTLFTNEEATRNNFFKQVSHYSIVTIFSHAKADTTDAEPTLFMQDSLIHLSDLQRLEKPAIQFVLLSACQTNIGKNATGEGIYSLARGFASVGVPSVSATLWKADEGAVYLISTKFNEYLAQGMNKSEALQKAKIDYLNHCDREHTLPYYWANMVVIGNSQPVVLISSNHWWAWVSGVVALLFIFGYALFYQKKPIWLTLVKRLRQIIEKT